MNENLIPHFVQLIDPPFGSTTRPNSDTLSIREFREEYPDCEMRLQLEQNPRKLTLSINILNHQLRLYTGPEN